MRWTLSVAVRVHGRYGALVGRRGVGAPRDNRYAFLGPETEAALARVVISTLRPAMGYLIEVDLGDDALMF